MMSDSDVDMQCPHCNEPSLTLTFDLDGDLVDFEQRCDCWLSEDSRDNVVDAAWERLADYDYPYLRD